MQIKILTFLKSLFSSFCLVSLRITTPRKISYFDRVFLAFSLIFELFQKCSFHRCQHSLKQMDFQRKYISNANGLHDVDYKKQLTVINNVFILIYFSFLYLTIWLMYMLSQFAFINGHYSSPVFISK